MYLKNINICDFRTLKSFELDFNDKKNLIFGDNGVGKTSILEAIYLLGFGKSFNEKKLKNLIRYGEEKFSVSSSINCLLGKYKIDANYNNQILSLHIDEKKKTVKDIQKFFFPLYFSSEFGHVILSSQNERRKFFNRLIFGLDALYISILLSYNHSIYQKNVLLKQNSHIKEISSWNQVICEMAYKITKYRYDFVEKINNELKELFGFNIYIKYDASIQIENYPTSGDFLTFLNDNLYIDKKYRYSYFGPHRDRFIFYSFTNKDIISCSSGEKKIYFLYLYLCYVEMFFAVRGEYPVFLIDDYDTALDEKNKGAFQEINEKVQIISTAVKNDVIFDYSFCLNKGDF